MGLARVVVGVAGSAAVEADAAAAEMELSSNLQRRVVATNYSRLTLDKRLAAHLCGARVSVRAARRWSVVR